MAEAAWRSFLMQVDEEEPEVATLQTVEVSLFDKAKLKSPKAVDGIKLSKLEAHADFPKDFAAQAFLARVLRSLEAISLANQVAKEARMSSRPAGPESASARELAAKRCPLKFATLMFSPIPRS